MEISSTLGAGAHKIEASASKVSATPQAPGKRGRPAGVKKQQVKLRDNNSFQTYIYRVLKEVKPDVGISKSSMSLINNLISELFENIMKEARNLMIFSKKQTLTSKEIETAIKLLFPGELCKLAVQTSRNSLTKFSE